MTGFTPLMREKMSNSFLLSWDHLGLESCINVTAMEKEQVWSLLKNENESSTLQHMVSMIICRARANSQRHYEIYTITMDGSIIEDDVRNMFKYFPQAMADLIRDRGNKIYSDRLNQNEELIT